MEFCGAGSLQDIYQGEWQGEEIRQPLALQSTCPVPLPLHLWGLSFWSMFHTEPFLWTRPGLEDAGETVVPKRALNSVSFRI